MHFGVTRSWAVRATDVHAALSIYHRCALRGSWNRCCPDFGACDGPHKPTISHFRAGYLCQGSGAVITGLATLLGLPIVFVTYRKTRVEISKLELEANALRAQQASRAGDSRDEEGNIRILVDHSPNTSIQVLADPRFLALSFSFWTSFSLG